MHTTAPFWRWLLRLQTPPPAISTGSCETNMLSLAAAQSATVSFAQELAGETQTRREIRIAKTDRERIEAVMAYVNRFGAITNEYSIAQSEFYSMLHKWYDEIEQREIDEINRYGT